MHVILRIMGNQSNIGAFAYKNKKPSGRLTDKQEKFCRIYTTNGGVGTRAYLEAGYAPKDASIRVQGVLKNPKVSYRITQLQAEATKRFEITIDEVTHKLLRAYDGAMDAEQFSAAIRSAELLGKHLGMFVERTHHHHTIAGLTTGQDATAVEHDIKNLVRIAQTTKDYETGETIEQELYVPEDTLNE